jgi:hypothetical protein
LCLPKRLIGAKIVGANGSIVGVSPLFGWSGHGGQTRRSPREVAFLRAQSLTTLTATYVRERRHHDRRTLD